MSGPYIPRVNEEAKVQLQDAKTIYSHPGDLTITALLINDSIAHLRMPTVEFGCI